MTVVSSAGLIQTNNEEGKELFKITGGNNSCIEVAEDDKIKNNDIDIAFISSNNKKSGCEFDIKKTRKNRSDSADYYDPNYITTEKGNKSVKNRNEGIFKENNKETNDDLSKEKKDMNYNNTANTANIKTSILNNYNCYTEKSMIKNSISSLNNKNSIELNIIDNDNQKIKDCSSMSDSHLDDIVDNIFNNNKTNIIEKKVIANTGEHRNTGNADNKEATNNIINTINDINDSYNNKNNSVAIRNEENTDTLTQNKSNIGYRCPVCNILYMRQSRLTVHIRTHVSFSTNMLL